MHYWLVKTEPSTFSWSDLVREKKTNWTGVRNYQARNNLRAMKKGDLVFVYHSVEEKAIVGIARVTKEASVDHTATDGDWSLVEIAVVKSLERPVALEEIKLTRSLKKMVLVNNARLSVQPVLKKEWDIVSVLSCSVA